MANAVTRPTVLPASSPSSGDIAWCSFSPFSHGCQKVNSKRYQAIRINHAHGATAAVDIAIDKHTSQQVAIKRVLRSRTTASAIAKEVRLHLRASAANHSHILCLKDVLFGIHEVEFVMPYLSGGDLLDAIAPDVGLDCTTATRLAAQLYSALTHLHSLGIAHRDVKPENILLTSDRKTLKLCDFGYAIFVNETQSRDANQAFGTVPYLAPEVFGQRGLSTMTGQSISWKACDVWAGGICFFAMLTGRFPWGAAHPSSLEFALFSKGTHSRDELRRWHGIAPAQRELVYKLLSLLPHQRPLASEAWSALLHIATESATETTQ